MLDFTEKIEKVWTFLKALHFREYMLHLNFSVYSFHYRWHNLLPIQLWYWFPLQLWRWYAVGLQVHCDGWDEGQLRDWILHPQQCPVIQPGQVTVHSEYNKLKRCLKKKMLPTMWIGSRLRAQWQNDPYKNKYLEQPETRRTIRLNRHLE